MRSKCPDTISRRYTVLFSSFSAFAKDSARSPLTLRTLSSTLISIASFGTPGTSKQRVAVLVAGQIGDD